MKPGQRFGEEARDYLDHPIGGKTVRVQKGDRIGAIGKTIGTTCAVSPSMPAYLHCEIRKQPTVSINPETLEISLECPASMWPASSHSQNGDNGQRFVQRNYYNPSRYLEAASQKLPYPSLDLSQVSYQSNDQIAVAAAVAPSLAPAIPGATTEKSDSQSVMAHVYVALQVLNGSLLFLQGGGSLSPDLQSIVRNWPISLFTDQIFVYTFSGGEPVGNYACLAAFTEPGTLNFIGSIVSSPFSFSP